MITIFTPSYNRADLLPRLYKSLCEQTCKDFEWLIVDDGSKDNTKEVVELWLNNKDFPIYYYQKNNGGKHTAINMGVELAKGELFFIADSDDFLPPNAIAIVMDVWNGLKSYSTVRTMNEFGGVCGLDGYEDGRIIGSGLPKDIIDISYTQIRDRYSVTGDMKEVYVTSVMKEFPFPEIDGERFCSEALIWNRIAKKYKLRFFNKVIYIAVYQEGGITAGITKARMKSPIATMMSYSEWFCMNISLKQKVKMAINYWRFAFCTKTRSVKIASWGNLLAPIGWLLFMNDKYHTGL